ncbi:RICIN domain-containing protein [Streptomyces sp. NPDC019531]|uniref:RICIN domain-containing protein n=1 Tax=Streptomyces sp. NPDC019531 TaxID=3365062 RepID=UPI00384F144A
MSFTAAALGLVTGIAAAGEAQATTYWRSIKFVHAHGYCLTVQAHASTAKGKRELIKKCNSGTAQAWRMDFSEAHSTLIAKLHPGGDTSKCLDGAKTEKTGTEWYLHAVKCNSSTSQQWTHVLADTQGLWSAQNYKTKLCIAPRKRAQSSGTWVVTTKCSGSTGSRQMLQAA